MKLFVLAASIGYVLGAADGADCGTLLGQSDAVTCDAGLFCDLAATAAGDGTTAEDAATSGVCTARLANGADCTAAPTTCIETDYCKANVCATLEVADATCVLAGDCAGGVCEGPCGASLTCGANANADGAVGGCCSTDVAVTDTAANYCSADGVVTVKIANGAACDTASAAWCASGGCTATTDANDGATVGTCDTPADPIADGATGGACAIAVTGVTAVDCTVSGDTCSTATATDGAAGICQAADGTPATATDGAAAGANGGACNAAVTEVVAIDCTVTTDTCTNSICTAATDDGDDTADDDSPAALFYGLSMVTGAIAYLL